MLLLLTLLAVVQGQDYTYTTNNGTITITKYIGPGGAVVIPSTITGLPVTTIGYAAFSDLAGLTSVTVSDSVTSIELEAFSHCASLTNVTTGNGVTNVGAAAFSQCINLTTVTIGDSVTSIGVGTFSECASLTDLTLGTNVTSIGYNAFFKCTNLTSVTLPNSLANLVQYTFTACFGLTNVTIGAGVTNISSNAFYYCTSLKGISVAALNSVYSSVDGVLFDKTQTTLVKCPQGRVGSYTVPGSVTSVGYSAFASCTSLTDITIPNAVTTIGDSAFFLCANLTAVYCEGNAPSPGGSSLFPGGSNATVYYLPGTTGWGPTFGGRPTALWFLPHPIILDNGPSFGVQTNQFGFIISWATIVPVTVEACTNLSSPVWSAVQSVTLTNGSAYFSDPDWTNYPRRFYRLRWP